ncbi:unnamed protein product [Arctogadus glacialis]
MDEEREDGGSTSKTTLSVEHGRRSKAEKRRQERADPPGPSCVSMKSEHYMGIPPELKDGRPSREEGRIGYSYPCLYPCLYSCLYSWSKSDIAPDCMACS